MFDKRRECSRNIHPHDPSQTIRIRSEVGDLEGHLFPRRKSDLVTDSFFALHFAVDFLSIHFHHVIHRTSVSGTEFVLSCFLDLNEAAGDLNAAARIGRWLGAAKFFQLFGHLRLD